MLTDEQVGACIDETERISPYGKHHFGWYIEFARAIEAETLAAHQQAIEAAVLAEREALLRALYSIYDETYLSGVSASLERMHCCRNGTRDALQKAISKHGGDTTGHRPQALAGMIAREDKQHD